MKLHSATFPETHFVGGTVLGIGNTETSASSPGGKLAVIKISDYQSVYGVCEGTEGSQPRRKAARIPNWAAWNPLTAPPGRSALPRPQRTASWSPAGRQEEAPGMEK